MRRIAAVHAVVAVVALALVPIGCGDDATDPVITEPIPNLTVEPTVPTLTAGE